ncbi:MAG: hypothetical protein IRZ21_06025 [Thermoleophilaceae bacterium]|nr:hypothetical protein [Thermoleophilaceae bacterium]
MIGTPGKPFVRIVWAANPFRGDKVEEWGRRLAELALDYGASAWAWVRSQEDPLTFEQYAVFPSKLDFERYWYSEEVSALRTEAQGWFHVPVLPEWFTLVDAGEALTLEELQGPAKR